ncbi:MAG: zinc dependent phospholipase C family protein [Nitrosomonadales bacterium]|nr:zinc dependent phospholipase C family protein [Nitrosomonadales bacterium]
MPGAYAHITLVNHLRLPHILESIPGFDNEAAIALMDHFKFCELGAVSPDYPYLVPMDKRACQWADAMHYTNTGGMIRSGIRRLSQMNRNEDWRKAFAWLCGYAAHVGTDMTIHPVVELKVGEYALHKKEHRECEMHQDAYIFQRLDLGPIGLAEYLDSSIGKCCSASDSGKLEPVIAALWGSMLAECHPVAIASNPPEMNKWHQAFKLVVDKVAEEGGKLSPCARHLAVDCGLTYPETGSIDTGFIKGLSVPGGKMDYDELFDQAIGNVKAMWSLIWTGVFAGNTDYQAGFGEWNLDTGRDNSNQLVFWS